MPKPKCEYDPNHAGHAEGSKKGWSNLIPIASLPPERQFEIRSKGGKVRMERVKLMKKQSAILRELLALADQDEERRKKLIEQLGMDGIYAESINYAAIEKAAKGDIEAARYIRDTIGEKPRDGLEIGNLDDKPLETIDLSKLSDEELKRMAANRSQYSGADSGEEASQDREDS